MISLDRCGDIVKLNLKGDNFGYFAPCGYVSPKYYDDKVADYKNEVLQVIEDYGV